MRSSDAYFMAVDLGVNLRSRTMPPNTPDDLKAVLRESGWQYAHYLSDRQSTRTRPRSRHGRRARKRYDKHLTGLMAWVPYDMADRIAERLTRESHMWNRLFDPIERSLRMRGAA